MDEIKEMPTKNEQHHRDSCTYSVEIAKQFLAFGVAGVGFVIGMALKYECSIGPSWYWTGGLFIASIACGLLYLMSVVAHVNQCNNYDVYTGLLKCFSLLQIVIFVCALVLLTVITLRIVGTIKDKVDKPNVSIQFEKKSLELTIPDTKRATIKITGNDAEVIFDPLP
jgi:hypothetical protein